MSEERDRIDALAEDVLPALIARLRRSRLGELEVATDGWRVRLRRDVTAHPAVAADPDSTDPGGTTPEAAAGILVRSPGVGYFSPSDDLVMGRTVRAGDVLGTVDVLGISHDVSAPAGGMVARILTEPDQAVEYGQVLVEVDALEMALEGVGDDPEADIPDTAGAGGAVVG
jgi:biotin carboxyl carrier protein